MLYRSIIALLLSSAFLTACQPSASPSEPVETSASAASVENTPPQEIFLGSDIRNEKIGADFELTNHLNQSIKLSDDTSKVKVIIFGYTHCPDICPTNLLSYNEAMNMLGDQAKDVQVYFITIDPERDTPELLSKYVPLFNENFIGLWPEDDSKLNQLKKDWHVTATKVTRDDGLYFMDHSTGTYLLNSQNETVVYEPHGVPAKQIATDIKALIELEN